MRRVLIGAFLGLFFWGFQVLRLKLGAEAHKGLLGVERENHEQS